MSCPQSTEAYKLHLSFEAKAVREENDYLPTDTCNSYDLWVYPKAAE
ncbi:MAG: hypothetical protein LUG26_00185 [Ruminococcus sp.]|nr:hypothetical protein [Ruminococcus sp.]